MLTQLSSGFVGCTCSTTTLLLKLLPWPADSAAAAAAARVPGVLAGRLRPCALPTLLPHVLGALPPAALCRLPSPSLLLPPRLARIQDCNVPGSTPSKASSKKAMLSDPCRSDLGCCCSVCDLALLADCGRDAHDRAMRLLCDSKTSVDSCCIALLASACCCCSGLGQRSGAASCSQSTAAAGSPSCSQTDDSSKAATAASACKTEVARRHSLCQCMDDMLRAR